MNETTTPIREVQHDDVAGSYREIQGNRKFIYALKNSLNEYSHISHHYCFDDATNEYSRGEHNEGMFGWDKSKQELSLMEIPSIFYGSQIEKGSVVLQYFITGTLAAECRDIKKNGELIQVSGTFDAAKTNNKVAGVVLYNEGFLVMTGSWSLNGAVTDKYVGTDQYPPKWKYFGVGANDGSSRGNLINTMYKMSFRGINNVPTITMFAHMNKGELNNSTNPTNKTKGESLHSRLVSGSTRYMEFSGVNFHRLEHSEYADPSGSYDKQVYVSKVGIYDDQKRLIGIAKLANPIRKTENREYTFKLKLDI